MVIKPSTQSVGAVGISKGDHLNWFGFGSKLVKLLSNKLLWSFSWEWDVCWAKSEIEREKRKKIPVQMECELGLVWCDTTSCEEGISHVNGRKWRWANLLWLDARGAVKALPVSCSAYKPLGQRYSSEVNIECLQLSGESGTTNLRSILAFGQGIWNGFTGKVISKS